MAGTRTVIFDEVAEMTEARDFPKNTILLEGVDSRLEPLIVTLLPTGPDWGEKLLMVGLIGSRKWAIIVVTPFSVRVRGLAFPEAAPLQKSSTCVPEYPMIVTVSPFV